jgi:hypothetical protein
MRSRQFETHSLPSSLATTHRGFAFYVAFPKRSIVSRSLPLGSTAHPRGFTGHVAVPNGSIPLIATCSISEIPFLD